MITQIYHKKNELFKVEYFQDEECTEAFDFTNAKNLYIQTVNGDISPLTALNDDVRHYAKIYIPYIPANQKPLPDNVLTLDDITPNLSKYIQEDNAVLFLSEEDKEHFYVKEFSEKVLHRTPLVSQDLINRGKFPRNIVYGHFNDNNSSYTLNGEQKGVHPIYRKITIFLSHGTQSELQKANEVEKELKEKYGVEEVNLFVLHCFTQQDYILNIYGNCLEDSCLAEDVCNFNKIITTNSTGILKPEDSTERLQVIDCKEIFEEYLKENN